MNWVQLRKQPEEILKITLGSGRRGRNYPRVGRHRRFAEARCFVYVLLVLCLGWVEDVCLPGEKMAFIDAFAVT